MKSPLQTLCSSACWACSAFLLWGCANTQNDWAEVTSVRKGAASTPSVKPALPPQSEPSPMVFSERSPSDRSASHEHDVVLMAMAMLDRNYTYGGKRLHTGFDCSGFVSFVYKEAAKRSLQGSASDQARQTQPITNGAQRPGDLVFFNTTGQPNSHVGIYVGNGRFVHAENERTGIKSSRLDQGYWSDRFEGFRRAGQ